MQTVIRTRTDWKVYLDDLFVKKELSNSTMVYLSNKPAFIGGRPSISSISASLLFHSKISLLPHFCSIPK